MTYAYAVQALLAIAGGAALGLALRPLVHHHTNRRRR